MKACDKVRPCTRLSREPWRALRGFPIYYPTPTMRTTYATTLCLALAVGFWYCLTTTLTDMTKADCIAGIAKACDQLKQDGIPIAGPPTADRDQ